MPLVEGITRRRAHTLHFALRVGPSSANALDLGGLYIPVASQKIPDACVSKAQRSKQIAGKWGNEIILCRDSCPPIAAKVLTHHTRLTNHTQPRQVASPAGFLFPNKRQPPQSPPNSRFQIRASGGICPQSQSRSQFVKLHGFRELHNNTTCHFELLSTLVRFGGLSNWTVSIHFQHRNAVNRNVPLRKPPLLTNVVLVSFLMYQPKWRSAIGRCRKIKWR